MTKARKTRAKLDKYSTAKNKTPICRNVNAEARETSSFVRASQHETQLGNEPHLEDLIQLVFFTENQRAGDSWKRRYPSWSEILQFTSTNT